MSLTFRAVLAVLLTVVFYALALLLAGALLWQSFAALFLNHGHLDLMPAIVAVFILWGIFPRRERFVAPGLKVGKGEQPRLWDEVTRTAEATGQPVPSEVYLILDFSAFVTERDAGLFFPGPRVLALGVPLMRSLSVSELRAVLAHEFGHYAGGDTRLGAWIYRTGVAIERASASSGHLAVHLLFGAYGKAFQWITAAISRRQELAADEVSARVAGAASAISALRRLDSDAPLYSCYWSTEVVPLLAAGCRPPIRDGYVRFLQSRGVAEARKTMAATKEKTRALDSHPVTSDRLAAIERLGLHSPPAPDATPAVELLSDNDGDVLERRIIDALAPEPLRDVSWDAAYAQALPPAWAEASEYFHRAVAKRTPARLPDVARKPGRIANRWAFLRSDISSLNREDLRAIAVNAVGPALALTLTNLGWRIESAPGEPVVLTDGGLRIEPFDVLPALIEKRMEPSDWLRTAETAGISATPLGAAAAEWKRRQSGER